MSEKINFKLYGINDDHDTCEQCGKTNLKRVMWIGTADTDPAPYGTVCGARKMGVNATGGAERVNSRIINEGIAQVWEAYGNFVENETFGRGGMSVPKPMIFVEWLSYQKGEITLSEFVEARNEQFQIMRASQMDTGSFFSRVEKLNEMLAIAENVQSGLKVVRG